MPAINTNECKEMAEYILVRIQTDDNWDDYDSQEKFELFQPEESNDDFTLTINKRDYTSRSHGIRFTTDISLHGEEVEYEIIVKRVR